MVLLSGVIRIEQGQVHIKAVHWSLALLEAIQRARPTVIGASPGGHPSPFCEQLYAISMPFSSTFTGMPPSEVTQSAMTSASTSCAASQMGLA